MKADYVDKGSKTSTNETVSYKITMPLINDEELQRIDNHYNELVDEFTKQFVKEKDMIITQRIMMNLRKENEKLKEQLKQKEDNINKANFANIEQLMLDYCAKTEEQKEFIDWLENEIENCKYGEENYADGDDMTYHNENELRKEILSKYKEIIGGKNK